MTTQELKQIVNSTVKLKEQADKLKETNEALYQTCDNLLLSLCNAYVFDETTDPKTN